MFRKKKKTIAPDWIDKLAGVAGWLDNDEARLLHRLAGECHAKGRCVELGSYMGRSTVALAAALPEGHTVLAVDTFRGSPEHQHGEKFFDPATLLPDGSVDTFPVFAANIARAGLGDRVEAWRMETVAAADAFSGSIALLFVDADHAYAAVTADIAAWRRHLAAEAVVVLHDVGCWEGPTRCAADLIAAGFRRLDQAGTALALRVPAA
ncbi:MAG TPA: class I SAM-dependent methyltransferase [Kaistiaceae bacterium]|nr:class I SAM-dependent methyltransferase [Kaistiaceae bacterium]